MMEAAIKAGDLKLSGRRQAAPGRSLCRRRQEAAGHQHAQARGRQGRHGRTGPLLHHGDQQADGLIASPDRRHDAKALPAHAGGAFFFRAPQARRAMTGVQAATCRIIWYFARNRSTNHPMKVFRGLPNDRARAPCALTIGNFDGVHRGHQALLAHVTAAAQRLGLEAAVMTFEPHPREYFARRSGDLSKAPGPHRQPARQAGIAVQRRHRPRHRRAFQRAFRRDVAAGIHRARAGRGPAREMADGRRRFLLRRPPRRQRRHAGRSRQANTASRSHSLPAVLHDATRISSSAVRAALAAGDFDATPRPARPPVRRCPAT